MVWWGLGARFLVRGIVSTCDIDRLCLLGFDTDINDIEISSDRDAIVRRHKSIDKEMGQLYRVFVHSSEKRMKRQ